MKSSFFSGPIHSLFVSVWNEGIERSPLSVLQPEWMNSTKEERNPRKSERAIQGLALGQARLLLEPLVPAGHLQ